MLRLRRSSAPTPVVLTAVLPRYRQGFLEQVSTLAAVRFISGNVHSDPTVATGVDQRLYTPTGTRFFAGRRLFVHTQGHWAALQAPVTVVDLNPRSLSAWYVVLARRLLRRRTLVWGHVFPRAGQDAWTFRARRAMMRISNGVVTYTLTDRERIADLVRRPAWAATNALYSAAELAAHRRIADVDTLVYVGRMEAEKKPRLLLGAFLTARERGLIGDHIRLAFVGTGSEVVAMTSDVARANLSEMVTFHRPAFDARSLSAIYGRVAAAVSPGYGGLLITQSLGFGCPVVLPRDERHAPEIELAQSAWTIWFERDDTESLAGALAQVVNKPPSLQDMACAAKHVRTHYSTDSMARGFVDALRGENT